MIDFKTFLENFDAIAEAPGGIPKLRSLILDLAVRGKLVPQHPEDEPASKMMEQIKFKSSGRSLKLRRGVPEIVVQPDYICDWEIPKNWICTSAAELLHSGMVVDIKDGNHGGNHPRKEEFTEEGIPFITAAQVNNFQIDYQGAYKLSGKPLERIRVGFADKGDVIYTHKGSIGRVAIAEQDCVLTPQTTYYRVHSDAIFNRYLMWYLCSPQFTNQVDSVKTQTTRDFVPITQQYLFFHIIPPLAEQKRIVEKVDELMGLCDRYEAAKQTRDNLRQKLRGSAIASLMYAETDEELDAAWTFVRDNWQNLSQHPEDVNNLRQSVLVLAVRGKLVPQNSCEEAVSVLLKQIKLVKLELAEQGKIKKTKPIGSIPVDEIPYQIPGTWEWVWIDNISDIGTGSTPLTSNTEYYEDGSIPWITSTATSQEFIYEAESYITELAVKDYRLRTYKPGCLIIALYGQGKTRGQISRLKIPATINQACAAITLIHESEEHREYIRYVFKEKYEELRALAAGGAQPNLNVGKIKATLIPLPPLAEQKRIVAKVDELMQLCDQLEASLCQSQQRAESLAASAISHLTI